MKIDRNKLTGFLTLSFDDSSSETVRNVLPLLKKYGFTATFNVPIGLLDGEIDGMKVASLKDLENLKKSRMEIASHSLTHISLTNQGRVKKLIKTFLNKRNKKDTLIKAFRHFSSSIGQKSIFLDCKQEIIESKSLLNKYGFSPTSFVYPKGNYDQEIKELVMKNYQSARTTNPGFNSYKALDFYELKSFLWDKDTKLDEANNWVEAAISKGVWLIETFHLVAKENKTDYEYFTSASDFENHLKYLSKQPLSVATQQEVIESLNI